MAFNIIMPKAGMAMETGTIIKWLKNEGEFVQSGEPLLEIETDKVNMEVEAMDTGYLLKKLYDIGAVVPVTETIGFIGEKNEKGIEPKSETPQKKNQAQQDIEAYDIIVVGGGPAGYIAAIKAARMGAKTALVEKSVVGGTCLNRGCIPTKTYLKTAEIINHIRHAASRGVMIKGSDIKIDMSKAISEKNKVVARLTGGVGALLKSSGVVVFYGEAKVHQDKTVTVGDKKMKAEKVILAAGSKAAKLDLPGMGSKKVLTSDEILDIDRVPEKLIIIGGGVIGVEMASVFNAFGSKVTIIEMMENVLPMMDADISRVMRKSLEDKGITIVTGVKLEKIEEKEGGISVYTDTEQPIDADCALLSIGRMPDFSAVETLDIALDRGRIKVDDTMKSSIDWLYAPGDINGRCMLAHAAFKMGEVAAKNATGHSEKVDLSCVPSCAYTSPEVGSVGMTEQKAKASHDVSIGRFPFCANGRALASGEGEGFVKVIADKKYGEVLGVHIVGPSAAELINEAAGLMAMEVTVNEIARIVHGHPTFSEAFMEAAADSIGECLHLPAR